MTLCESSYYGSDIFSESTTKITLIPFYGGGKGQSLQIIESADGTVTTAIIRTPTTTRPTTPSEEMVDAAELENPPLPNKQDHQGYGFNLRNIHRTALNIIKLQEQAKKNGKLSPHEESVYQQNMDILNQSARNLANAQESSVDFENREGLGSWFDLKRASTSKKDKKKQEEEKRKKEEEGKKKKEEEEEKRRKEEEEKKRKEEEENKEEEEIGENEDNDAIAIQLPSDDASVAEAKPVGLAVAGEGGVAASKPIATAVVGPGGLAIARPVGTAIAGVSPDQALVPIYAEGYILGSKPKRYGSSGGSSSNSTKKDTASEYLNKIISKYHQN